jgi:hypothetical protein
MEVVSEGQHEQAWDLVLMIGRRAPVSLTGANSKSRPQAEHFAQWQTVLLLGHLRRSGERVASSGMGLEPGVDRTTNNIRPPAIPIFVGRSGLLREISAAALLSLALPPNGPEDARPISDDFELGLLRAKMQMPLRERRREPVARRVSKQPRAGVRLTVSGRGTNRWQEASWNSLPCDCNGGMHQAAGFM